MPLAPRIRDFDPADRAACLEIMDANTPAFFDPSERKSFEEFLSNPIGRFVVVQDGGDRVIGCGGYVTVREGKNARLVWGMIAPAFHGRGLGRLLALTRLRWIAALDGVQSVSLDTSQKSAGFYLLFGFGPANVVHDGYGPGLDRIDMELALDSNAREILLGRHAERDTGVA